MIDTKQAEAAWQTAMAMPHIGGAKSDQALVRNVRTCRPDAKGDVQAAKTMSLRRFSSASPRRYACSGFVANRMRKGGLGNLAREFGAIAANRETSSGSHALLDRLGPFCAASSSSPC
jgi:hypothetical protein